MANAHEAARHDVDEKTAQEFVGLQRHDLHAVVVGVVLPTKPDATLALIDEPVIRERAAVRVPTQIVEHLRGAREGSLGIQHPVDGPQRPEEAGEGVASARSAVPPAKVSWPASNARRRPVRYFARKTIDIARTGNKKADRPERVICLSFRSSLGKGHEGTSRAVHADRFFTGTGTPAIFTLTENSVLLEVK